MKPRTAQGRKHRQVVSLAYRAALDANDDQAATQADSGGGGAPRPKTKAAKGARKKKAGKKAAKR